MLYIVGVVFTYEVFEQQFVNFFTSFFSNEQVGPETFVYVTTLGKFLNATMMFFAPVIVMKIGSKNTLLVAGAIMSIRITGSAFASSFVEVVILKTLNMFEAPRLLVGAFKYITKHFPIRFFSNGILNCFLFRKTIIYYFYPPLQVKYML